MRRVLLALAVTLAAVAALVGVECLRPIDALPQSQALADGSVLKVESVSFGSNHSYREIKPKAWQLAVGKWLPYALAARLGWRFNTQGWTSISNPNGWTSLVIFTEREGPGRSARDQLRMAVLDENGNSLSDTAGGGSAAGMDKAGTHFHTLQSWSVDAFPRRGKSLVVRFLRKQGGGQADVPVMQLRVPNPQPGVYPTWTPEPWPAAKDAGDLAVTLADFTTGLGRSQPERAALENEEAVTRLALDLRVRGQTNCSWVVRKVEISDATDNHWNSIPWGVKTKNHAEGLTRTMYLSGNLWPGESAWKLRIELSPAKAPRDDVRQSRFVEFIAKPRTP